MTKEYIIDLQSIYRNSKKSDPDKSDRIETVVRKYLLDNSDKVRLSQRVSRYGFLFRKKGHDEDPKFQKTVIKLAPDFIEKVTNNERYHVAQGRATHTHYFYRLSPRLKDLINQTTLIWMNLYTPDDNSILYGFEDPSFYKGERLLGQAVGHENYIFLNLEDSEADELKKLGVGLEKLPPR